MSEEKKTPEKKAPEKAPRKFGLFARIAKWFRELRSELRKVTWPGRPQIINNTWVALVVMSVCAFFIWIFDWVAGLAVQSLINLFR